MERVWLYLRERFLSLRFLPDTEAIIEACCDAWRAIIAEPGRIKSLCAALWITKVILETHGHQCPDSEVRKVSKPGLVRPSELKRHS
ncbi:MAG: hypothetical protein H6843_12830 [Rhodospirillaceae bacterium]|nr:hypothetical protein [Rhodospirillaceae bacterium]